jgi:hypothetical protein
MAPLCYGPPLGRRADGAADSHHELKPEQWAQTAAINLVGGDGATGTNGAEQLKVVRLQIHLGFGMARSFERSICTAG